MNVLVTGGAGFIGTALTDRLLAAGHRVTVVDDLSAGDPARLSPAARLHETDIASDDLRPVFADARPDAVCHLAAQASVGESVREPCRGAAVNVGGTVRLLDQCAAWGVARFVFASSGGTLYGGSTPVPAPESQTPEPLSPYGASKAAAELYVVSMSRLAGMRYTILRLGNVYGPVPHLGANSGVVAVFARAMLDGRAPVIHGDGLQERDYVHVDDVVDAHLRALAMDEDGVFNIASGAARTVREVFDAVADAADYEGGPVHGPAQPAEVRHVRLDVSRARRVLGWSPNVPFSAGVAHTVRAMRGEEGA